MEGRQTQNGMKTFFVIWFGQFVSVMGTRLSAFALGVWVYQRTGSATQFALIALFTLLPTILISPFAGALVDRWDRRKTLILSDAGAAVGTLAIALLLFAGRLEVWHIYAANLVSSVFGAFQWPAYSATTTLLVPKQHLGRANGMMQISQAAAQIVAPGLAGLLLYLVSLYGVILIDFTTFLVALATLLIVRVPRPSAAADVSRTAKRSLLREAIYGWSYITQRPGLLGLLIFFAVNNFMLGIVTVLVTPLVLSYTSTAVLGTVLSVGGSGMLVGSLVMSAWGGFKRRVSGVYIFMMLSGVCMVLTGLRPAPTLLAVIAFIYFFGLPIVTSSSLAIWQSKTAPDVQGRVFALRSVVATSTAPIAYLIAGPLADRLFEPLLRDGSGAFAGSVGRLTGVGHGSGIGLIFILMGVLTIFTTCVGILYPRIRLVDEELPDMLNGDDGAANKAEELDPAAQPLVALSLREEDS